MNWTGQLILFSIATIVWLFGYSLHKNCSPNSEEAIRAPHFVARLFGSTRPDYVLSIRGIVGQLGVYIIGPAFALAIGGVIPLQVAVAWMGWSSELLLSIIIIHLLLRPMKLFDKVLMIGIIVAMAGLSLYVLILKQ